MSVAHEPLVARLHEAIAEAGGWLSFERFMELALHAPGLGYYARGDRQFGAWPAGGSDFVTAPEMSPLFGRTLAVQLRQWLDDSGTDTVVEFGAGSGALAEQLLQALGSRVSRYLVVELSAALRARQRERLAPFGERVQWLDRWPDEIDGVVVGNEVLDAMPVQLVTWDGRGWRERGVVRQGSGFAWSDVESPARPPLEPRWPPGAVTELHRQAEAFVATLAGRLRRGAALFIDYGFPEAEYYHEQRHAGTLMCHRGHRADADPLADVGAKDITAHVNFTGIALAGQDAGLEVVGYTSQARFLINCGLVEAMAGEGVAGRAAAQRLIIEHEMGELFKVLAFARGGSAPPLGFAVGDRTHTL